MFGQREFLQIKKRQIAVTCARFIINYSLWEMWLNLEEILKKREGKGWKLFFTPSKKNLKLYFMQSLRWIQILCYGSHIFSSSRLIITASLWFNYDQSSEDDSTTCTENLTCIDQEKKQKQNQNNQKTKTKTKTKKLQVLINHLTEKHSFPETLPYAMIN